MTAVEQERLRAARAGDEHAYAELVAPYRAGLRAHCTQLLGSDDAEDAVQETLLRAWRGLARFENRCPVSSWLYRIATNCALTMRTRRAAVTLHGAPEDRELALVAPAATPEARIEQREAVELALLLAHERLPARQRAVLILRDALGFSAGEVAASLQTTTASVNSSLQRARATVARRPEGTPAPATLADARLRRRVRRCADAWARADVDDVVAMLAADAA
jgi:RNA polymerase sigma-70 factor, ECF subfamily